jgi:hypothetical protein
MKNSLLMSLLIAFTATSLCNAQKQSFDLQQLLKENKLIAINGKAVPITDGNKKGVSTTGITWLKDVTFSTGTIEVDLRGKDVLQKSFIGIVFHGVDTSEFDIVYFRPFNFRSQIPFEKYTLSNMQHIPIFHGINCGKKKMGYMKKALIRHRHQQNGFMQELWSQKNKLKYTSTMPRRRP